MKQLVAGMHMMTWHIPSDFNALKWTAYCWARHSPEGNTLVIWNVYCVSQGSRLDKIMCVCVFHRARLLLKPCQFWVQCFVWVLVMTLHCLFLLLLSYLFFYFLLSCFGTVCDAKCAIQIQWIEMESNQTLKERLKGIMTKTTTNNLLSTLLARQLFSYRLLLCTVISKTIHWFQYSIHYCLKVWVSAFFYVFFEKCLLCSLRLHLFDK